VDPDRELVTAAAAGTSSRSGSTGG